MMVNELRDLCAFEESLVSQNIHLSLNVVHTCIVGLHSTKEAFWHGHHVEALALAWGREEFNFFKSSCIAIVRQ